MIDMGIIHRNMAMEDVTINQVSAKNEELNTMPETQVVATQVFLRPDRLQPNENSLRYDALIYYKYRSNIQKIIKPALEAETEKNNKLVTE